MVNGKFIVAQEITVQLSSDFTSAPKDLPAIGNLDKVIIDNKGKYMGNSNTNSFKVSEDGVYQVFMNCQLSKTKGGSPVIGVWDDTENNWVARVNDNSSAVNTYKGPPLQTYTLITSIPMKASHTYSLEQQQTKKGQLFMLRLVGLQEKSLSPK